MAAKGYANVDEVAAFLGLTLTTEQDAQAERMLEVAEAEVDGYCNRAWLVGVQTDEAHPYSAYRLGNLYLKYAPVSVVTTVKGRSALGEAEETLIEDTDYEVMSLDSGWIRLLYPASWDRIRVTYTPATTVPLDIQQATVELAANYLQSNLRPMSYGLDSLQLPDLSVNFSRAHVQTSMPPTVESKLARWRYWVVA
jgi:hypothetical protein